MPDARSTVLCDLDGTLYGSGVVYPGVPEAIAELRSLGCTLRFFTNTDSATDAALLERVRSRGLDIREGELFSPVTAAGRFFEAHGDANVLAVVDPGVAAAFAAREQGVPVTHVVVGDCRRILSYAVLDEAFRALDAGAELVALQRGRYFRAADGRHLDTGAVVEALAYASGSPIRLLGKPSPDFLAMAAASAEARPDEVWVVGDDATTDILMGNSAGSTTVQVRTGKYPDQEDERRRSPARFDIDSFAALPELVRTGTAAG